MNKKALLAFIVIAFTSSFCYGITKEELSRFFNSADTPNSLEEVTQLGLNNLPLLEEILLIPSGDYIPRFRAFSLLRRASQANQFPKERFFDIAFYQIKNLRSLASSKFYEDEQSVFSQMLAYYSYSPDTNFGVSVLENFQNLFLIINSMISNGVMNKHGILNSLEAKFRNAQKDFEKGHKATAINVLNAAQNEINSHTGKGIDKEGAGILTVYINNLIAQIEKQ